MDECFENYIQQLDILPDVSLPDIHKRIESLINIDDNKIEFIHPSLLEYLEDKLSLRDRKEIIKTAIYFEQIEKLDINKKYIRDLILLENNCKQPPILNFKVLPITYEMSNSMPIHFRNNISIQYLKYLYEFKIDDQRHEPIVIKAMKNILEDESFVLFYPDSKHILNIIKLNYNLREILNDDKYVKRLFRFADKENIWSLIELTIRKDEKGFDFKRMDMFIQNQIEDVLKDIGESVWASWIEDNIEDYLDDAFQNYGIGDEYYYDEIVDYVFQSMFDDFDFEWCKDEILNIIKKYHIYNIDAEDMDYSDSSNYIYDIIEDAVIDFDNAR